MTVSEGYPDWQHIQTRAGVPIAFLPGQSIPAATTFGPWYLANWPSVTIIASPGGTSSYTMNIQWWADEAMTQSIEFHTVVIAAANWPYLMTHGVFSSWLSLRITPIAFVAGDTVDVVVTPTTARLPLVDLFDPTALKINNATVAAGATLTTNSLLITPGPGDFYFKTNATAWTMKIQYFSTGGVWTDLYVFDNTVSNGLYTNQIVLPPYPLRTQFTNSGAAAAQVSAVLGVRVF